MIPLKKEALQETFYAPIVLAPTVQQYFANDEVHERLLADKVRLSAFQEAIYEAVIKGDIVMDIGAGTGILSQYAIEAGAKKVYVVEENVNILKLAKKRLAKYTRDVEIVFIDKRSTDLKNSDVQYQSVNVIISETIGSMGFNEGIIGTIDDAKRFLVGNGCIVPNKFNLYLGHIKCHKLNELPRNELSVLWDAEDCIKLLSSIKLAEVNLMKSNKDVFNQVEVNNICADGYCFWFKANLSSNVTISNTPGRNLTSWGYVVLPLNNRQCKSCNITFGYNVKSKRKIDCNIKINRDINFYENIKFSQLIY